MTVRNKNDLFLPLFLGLMLLFSACKEDLQVNNTDQNFPLTLRSAAAGDGVKFDWDKSNVSGFEKYILVRSLDPIPTGMRPSASSSSFPVVFQSENVNETSFSELSFPITANLYYKLYIGFDGRFVESDNVKFSFDHFIENGFPTIIRFLPDSNWVIIGDEINAKLTIFDYIRNVKVSQLSTPIGSSGSETNIAKPYIKDGIPYLLWMPGNGTTQLSQFSLPDFSLKQSASLNSGGFDMQPNPAKNMVLTTAYDFSKGLQVSRLSDFSEINYVYRSEYYLRRPLALLDANSNKYVEVASNRILSYTVNGNGLTANQIESFSAPGTPLPQIVLSPDHQFFIPNSGGQILNQQLQEIARFPINVNSSYTDFAFSSDGAFVYSLSADFFSAQSTIKKYSFPSMEFISARSFPNVTPRAILGDNEGLVFIGANLNGFQQMLIKKLSL